MSTSLSDQEILRAASLLSSDRLAAFVKITGTERAAFEVHQQMMTVAAALMPVTGLIEIALRNAICDRLGQMFGVPNWNYGDTPLNSPLPPPSVPAARNAICDRLGQMFSVPNCL